MKSLFVCENVLLEDKFEKAKILVEDGYIKKILKDEIVDLKVDEVIDLKDKKLIPGFIDIHTHGGLGVDINHAKAKDYEHLCRFFASNGTTSFLCSILTDSNEKTSECIEEIKKWENLEHKGASILGIHLEGPFLAKEYKGAMPEHLLQVGNTCLIKEYQKKAENKIRYITISPEVTNNLQMIPHLREINMNVGIGHSGAEYKLAKEALDKGAKIATHTCNAMRPFHHHEPGIIAAVLLDDSVFCEIICDGRHLHPATVNLIIKTKGLDKVVAITDSIMAAGLEDGYYKLGVNDVVVKDKDARLVSNNARAGSTLTMIEGFKNILDFTKKSIEEISPLFSRNPARAIGVYEETGDIKENKRADFVVLDNKNDLLATFVFGKNVYTK